MKKSLLVMAFSVMLFSCSGDEKQEAADTQEVTELTAEEEETVAEALSSELQSDKEEVHQATEASLEEVDSLLENF